MTPDVLARLSTLLDEALELDPAAREAWLIELPDDVAELGPTLRKLLARQATKETADLLERGPAFTLPAGSEIAATAFHPGDAVGPYRLLRALGHGGMGEVWQAERSDGTLKRKVALKLPHVSWAPGLAERFAREREILSSLEHPHIARLYDAGFDPHGRPYMALEYVEGLPIDQFCGKRALAIEGRLRLLLQVADAVAFAHSRLVIHRDLKPGNILVTEDGQVRLLDFGIAKLMEGDSTQETVLTKVGGRALTLDYASPEQIRGEPIGTSSDVYSLAVVAFELLAGERPYRLKRGSAAELEEAIAMQDLPLASAVSQDAARKKRLAGDLDAILNKALKKSVTERYPTVDALAQDVRRHLDGQAVFARPDTLAYRLSRVLQRHRVPVAAVATTLVAFSLALGAGATALVIFVLALGLVAALWQARRARAQARLARAEGRKAEAVKRFLLDIFQANRRAQPDALKAQQTTARELLDIGAKRVDQALRDEPESHIEILESLGEIYFEIGLRGDATRLRRQATDLARQVFGSNDVRFAKIAILCARSMEFGVDRNEVPRLLDEANHALVASGQGDTWLRGNLLRELASFQGYESLGPALRTAEESAAVMMRVAIGNDVPSACRVAGRLRMAAGHYELAEKHYRNALAATPDPAEPDPAWQVNTHAELATALFKQGKIVEAESHANTALELSTQHDGADHRWTLVVKIRFANQLVACGDVSRAIALRSDVEQALAQDRPEYDADFRANMAGYLGMTLFDRGRPDFSEAAQREDLEDLRQNFPNSYMRAEREAELAELAVVYGRYDEAENLLTAGYDRWQRYSGGNADPARAAVFAVTGAHLAMAQGKPEAALSWLQQVALPTTAGRGRFWKFPLQLVAERAHLETLRGNAAAGYELAETELKALRQHLGHRQLPDAEARLLQARGQASQAQGDLQRAEADLREALALRRQHDDEASMWLAQVQIALAECLAASGQREEATVLLGEANHIHSQHPPLGPYFASALTSALGAVKAP